MNLLIVDDEPLVRRMVYEKVRAMNFPFQKIDRADSAAAARQMAEQTEYDIFLCDIVMPGEDGISFARWELGLHPECKFIFLTAHADYEYMKQAIALQSFDYILQPASDEEIYQTIERAIMQISIERKNRQLISAGSFYVGHEEEILDGNALRYLEGKAEDASFLMRLLAGNTQNNTEECTAVFPFYVQVLRGKRRWMEGDRALLRSIYKNIVDEVMAPLHAENTVIPRFGEEKENFIALMSFFGAVPSVREIERCLENLWHLFGKVVNMKVAVYAGRMCQVEDLGPLVRQLFEDESNNVRNAEGMYEIGSLSGAPLEEDAIPSRTLVWKKLLEQGKISDFRDAVLNYLKFCGTDEKLNQKHMLQVHGAVSELILTYMTEHNINSADVFSEELSYYQFLSSWHKLDDFQRAVIMITDRLGTITGTGNDTQLIMQYIHQHIDQDLSVSELAEMAGKTPEYLTKVFKKNTGMTLKKYIDHEKMEAAKVLLKTTQLPVTIISGYVGYSNYSNFTRSFRQIVGCTPSEFRGLST